MRHRWFLIAGSAEAIINIIVLSFDVIDSNTDASDAIIDIVVNIVDLVPLTDVNNAESIKRKIRTVSFDFFATNGEKYPMCI